VPDLAEQPRPQSSIFLDALDRLHERFLIGVDGVTEIWLVRHGDAYAELVSIEDAAGSEARGGIPVDPALSGKGRREAAQLAQRMVATGVDGIWSSQLLRAQETAGFTATALGLPVQVDDRLREVKTQWDNGAHRPRGDDPPAARYIPFVEPIEEVTQRMTAAISDIAARVGGGRRAMVVSHAGAISAYLSHVLHVEFGSLRLLVQFTSVSVVLIKDDHVVVQSIGDIGHLLREAVALESAQ
jgi:probable phosphoglycerate mutase